MAVASPPQPCGKHLNHCGTNGIIVVNGASGSGIMKADAMARIADALYRDEPEAELHGGKKIASNALSIKERKVEIESVVI